MTLIQQAREIVGVVFDAYWKVLKEPSRQQELIATGFAQGGARLAAAELAGVLLQEGAELPDWLRQYAADIMLGNEQMPKQTTGRLVMVRDLGLAAAALVVADELNVPVYANGWSGNATAVELVASVTKTTPATVRNAVRKWRKSFKEKPKTWGQKSD